MILILSFLNGQGNIKDSINYYLRNKKPVLIGGLSSRNTIIGSNKTSVTGMYGGFDYGGKVNLKFGIYWLAPPLDVETTLNEFTPSQKKIRELSRFWYWGFEGDYVFYKNKKWRLDIPLRIGIGGSSVKSYELAPNRTYIERKTGTIFPLESGISALYKLTWWIGFTGGIGSRIVLGSNNAQKYSGTYYNIGVTVFVEDIYNHVLKDMKEHPKKSKTK